MTALMSTALMSSGFMTLVINNINTLNRVKSDTGGEYTVCMNKQQKNWCMHSGQEIPEEVYAPFLCKPAVMISCLLVELRN